MKRPRRTFTTEFKAQIVKLYENGKPRKDIISEYELTLSALDKWIKQSQTSGSFKMRLFSCVKQRSMMTANVY
jgi:transposase